MNEDISFEAEDDVLRGWLYTPDYKRGPTPTIVMGYGFSAANGMSLDKLAAAFDEASTAARERFAERLLETDQ